MIQNVQNCAVALFSGFTVNEMGSLGFGVRSCTECGLAKLLSENRRISLSIGLSQWFGGTQC